MSRKTFWIAIALALLVGVGLTAWRMLRWAQAYAFAYPLVITDVTREASAASTAPENQLARVRRFPDAAFRGVVKPNVDTLYTVAFIDMSLGPWVFEMPPNDQRYELMPFMDAWTHVFAVPGTRLNGTAGGRYLLTPPNWRGEVPPGMTPIPAPTRIVWLIGRTQTNGEADFERVHRLQDGLRLSRLAGPAPGGPAQTSWSARPVTPPIEQMQDMNAEAFFSRVVRLMADNPAAEADAPMLARLRGLGLHPGQALAWNAADAWLAQQAVRLVQWQAARRLVKLRQQSGWSMPPANLGRYGTDYLTRMGVAMVGLGANLPEDAVYPGTTTDSQGRALDGRYRYRIRMTAQALPPVRAFWSITAYGMDDFLLDHPSRRYALSNREPLRVGADGSIELLIQADPPEAALRANWLPVLPDRPFQLTARLYWPQAEVLDGRWKMPAVERVEP